MSAECDDAARVTLIESAAAKMRQDAPDMADWARGFLLGTAEWLDSIIERGDVDFDEGYQASRVAAIYLDREVAS